MDGHVADHFIVSAWTGGGITLFLVPSLYMLQEDFFERVRAIRAWISGRPATADKPAA